MNKTDHYIIEETVDGKFTIRAGDSDVASLVFNTELEAISHATALGTEESFGRDRIVTRGEKLAPHDPDQCHLF